MRTSFKLPLKMKHFSNTILSEDIQFENTLLRNGIISPRVEEKLANIFDDAYKDIAHNDDSMLDTVSVYTTSDLSHGDKILTTFTDTFKNASKIAKFANKEHFSGAFTTSTPLRTEFDPYGQLFPMKIEGKKQVGDLDEIIVCESFFTETLLKREKSAKTCLPKLKKSFKKVRRSSKKGAIGALTVILSNIM